MTSPNAFSDLVRDCAERLSASGVDALGSLFDLTGNRLVRLAVAITRLQQDAEDAVQTALVRLASEPKRLAAAECPWAYLLQIVRNEALLIARRKKRCSTSDSLSDLTTFCSVDEAERKESHRAVWSALRLLPPEQSEVVVLKIWEDMTFAQIGIILDISLHTAASRYKYAMTKLAACLQQQKSRGAL